jgi:hypothetical protein
MTRALSTLLCACASTVLWTSFAMADGPAAAPPPAAPGAAAPPDKAACLAASNKAQELRDAHKLLEARDQLHICAQQVCPGVVSKDCLTWLDAVEQSLPSVVVSAKDPSGRDLFDVKVTADGQPLTAKLAGDAVAMNPGPHAFHFEAADGSVLDQQVLVREGLKNQNIAVVLGKAAAVPAAGAAPAGATPGAQPDATPAAEGGGGIPWHTVGWITGGVGVAGIALGSIFGIMAMGDKNGAHCDASGACDPSGLSSANSAATVSTVGFIAGGVLLAGGAALVLFGPSDGAPAAAAPATGGATLKVAPLVGSRDAGLVLGGSW